MTKEADAAEKAYTFGYISIPAGTALNFADTTKPNNKNNTRNKKAMGGPVRNNKRYTTTLTVNEEKQFKDWYSKVAKHKNLNPNPDADGQDYDYRGYWKNEDRDYILGSNPNAHFPDKYKQPTHPTFSNESIYSNDKTPGGTWVRGKGTWLFKHNKFTARQADRTANYLNGTGEGFILGTDTIIPNIKKRMGGLGRSKAKMGTIDWDKVDEYADTAEKTLGATNLGLSAATLVAPNPYTAVGAYTTGLAGIGTDIYQGIRSGIKKDWTGVGKNVVDIGLSLAGMRALKAAKKWDDLNKVKQTAGAPREYVIHTIGRRPKTIRKIKMTKEADAAEKAYTFGYVSIPAGTALNFADTTKPNNNKNNTNNKKAMGGLSRSKDYGSKSKPYPSVKSGDFAGGHRSYPIPTKADAIDALRLAGLHGRSDVRAKVYAKYPDLRKKSKSGGLYSVTVNGETKLKMFPSTGNLSLIRRKAALGTVGDDETDMSITNNEPFENTTLKEVVVTPEDVKDNTENRIAKNEKRNRLINSYLSGYHGDAINLLSNIGGNIATTLINRRALNKMQAPPQPMSQTAAKLKTRININPQLDKMRETLAAYERDVDNNTASSRVALARKQRARFANMLQTNELYSTKENAETELINKDRLNQQEVANNNVKAYNAWQDKVNAFKNAITDKKAENLVGLTQGITSGITSTIGNVQQRIRDDKSILANALSHPNLPIEEFYHNGLISKRAYKAYRKAHPLKTNTNEED